MGTPLGASWTGTGSSSAGYLLLLGAVRLPLAAVLRRPGLTVGRDDFGLAGVDYPDRVACSLQRQVQSRE